MGFLSMMVGIQYYAGEIAPYAIISLEAAGKRSLRIRRIDYSTASSLYQQVDDGCSSWGLDGKVDFIPSFPLDFSHVQCSGKSSEASIV